jgi:hypothetical protein
VIKEEEEEEDKKVFFFGCCCNLGKFGILYRSQVCDLILFLKFIRLI